METIETHNDEDNVYPSTNCAKKDDKTLLEQSEHSGCTSECSDFEESIDNAPSIEDALKNNLELMKKREELLMAQLRYNKVLVYDSNANNPL